MFSEFCELVWKVVARLEIGWLLFSLRTASLFTKSFYKIVPLFLS